MPRSDWGSDLGLQCSPTELLATAEDALNLHSLRVFEGTFSVGAARICLI